ncbi:MAG TPA: FtsL-like putative cell division protein [Lacibacter sp.]|nr:FtsL-like putative cell division protein [Lacibacter sp.]HMO87822.1 FtsL-like putative cell division protein [Lacibacter sp.]
MTVKEPRIDFRKWFNYQWIVRNVPFFLFLAFLAVLYIANGHYADNTIRDINRTTRLLKEQEYEYKTLNGKLMFQNRQTEVTRVVEAIGLKETIQQPIRLKDSTAAGQQ